MFIHNAKLPTELKICTVLQHSPSTVDRLCETQQPKNVCIHNKKSVWLIFFSLVDFFVRISQKEFSAKKNIFLSSTRNAALRRLRMEMKLYLDISCVNADEGKIVASRSFQTLALFWSEIFSFALLFTRYKIFQTSKLHDFCLTRVLAIHDHRCGLLLNMLLICCWISFW